MYDTSVSYGHTSSYAADKFLRGNTTKLYEKYLAGKEATHRMDESRFFNLQTLIHNFDDKFRTVHKFLEFDLPERIMKQRLVTIAVGKILTDQCERKDFLYRYQEYVVRKNFMRVRDAMEERTLSSVAAQFHEFALVADLRILQLFEVNLNETSLRKILYRHAHDTLEARAIIGRRSFDNYTVLFKSYQNGNPIFRYKFENIPRNNNVFIVPKPTLRNALTHNSYAAKYSVRLGSDIQEVVKNLENYQGILDTIYLNNTFNVSYMNEIHELFADSCEEFFFSKSLFYVECVDWPLTQVLSRRQQFVNLWQDYTTLLDEVINILDNMVASISYKTHLQPFLDITCIACGYLNGTSTLMELAVDLLSDHKRASLNDLQLYFQDVRSRERQVYDSWRSLKKQAERIWEMIIDDQDMIDYYEFQNINDFMRNINDVYKELDRNYTTAREMANIEDIMASLDSEFLTSFEDMTAPLSTYKSSIHLDSVFLR